MREETVWIDPLQKWVKTGHVLGTSPLEIARDRLQIISEVLNAYKGSLYQARNDWWQKAWRAKGSRRRRIEAGIRGLTRRINTAAGINKVLGELMLDYVNACADEAAQRRALFLQRLIQTPEYMRAGASRALVRAQIAELEAIQLGDDIAKNPTPRPR